MHFTDKKPMALATQEDRVREISSLEDPRGIAGSQDIKMGRGEKLVISPCGVFQYKDVRRRPAWADPSVAGLEGLALWKDRLAMSGRRFIGGEAMIQDVYEALSDEAMIRVSSDLIGGQLETIELEDRKVVARKAVFFGSGSDVKFRLTSPLDDSRMSRTQRIKLAAYGPGPVLQEFSCDSKARNRRLIMNFEGDWEVRHLGNGELLESTDPTHLYAWDDSVKLELVPFGNKFDLLFRGAIHYFVKAHGPGRVWFSNMGYTTGYWGNLCTPAHWIYEAVSVAPRMVANAFGLLKR